MYYRNVYGEKSDSSLLNMPTFVLPENIHFKLEFYYYIHSSGYQALELFQHTISGQYKQMWRSEALPAELEDVWTYACVDIDAITKGCNFQLT